MSLIPIALWKLPEVPRGEAMPEKVGEKVGYLRDTGSGVEKGVSGWGCPCVLVVKMTRQTVPSVYGALCPVPETP